MSAKTYTPRESEIERRWYVVDATDETLGRLATRIAHVLANPVRRTAPPAQGDRPVPDRLEAEVVQMGEPAVEPFRVQPGIGLPLRAEPVRGVADGIVLAISLLNLLFLVGIALWFRPMHPSELHGIPLIVEIVMGLGVLAAVLTVGAVVYCVLAWKDRYWGVAYRVYYILVTIAAIAFVWFLNYWNWLGWRY